MCAVAPSCAGLLPRGSVGPAPVAVAVVGGAGCGLEGARETPPRPPAALPPWGMGRGWDWPTLPSGWALALLRSLIAEPESLRKMSPSLGEGALGSGFRVHTGPWDLCSWTLKAPPGWDPTVHTLEVVSAPTQKGLSECRGAGDR